MDLFKNGVGRPSNETIKKRNIFKVICFVFGLIIIGMGLYILNDKGIINLNSKKSNANDKNITTITKVDNEEKNKDATTTLSSENLSIKEKYDKFVSDKKLKVYKDSEAFDMDGLKKSNCLTATASRNDDYSLEIFTFDNNENAKKEYQKQSDYQKNADFVVEVFSNDIVAEKSTDNYDFVNVKRKVEDINDGSKVNYDYYYGIRIDNYYISLFSTSNIDDYSKITSIKNQLNKIYEIN